MLGYSPLGATALGFYPPALVEPDPEPQPEPNPTGRDYAWLQASVIKWMHRKDLASLLPDLVMLAEERMSADLEARGMDSTISLPTAAGTGVVALPQGVVEIRAVGVPWQAPASYLSADAFSSRYSGNCVGAPRHYTVIGDALYLGPTPDGVYQLDLSARMTLPPLADEADGRNWLMERNPSLYLAATMIEAMTFTSNLEGQATWENKYQVALKSANSTKGTAGDLVVRSDSRTP